MVKKWIVVIVVTIILIAGCVWESVFLNNSFDYLEDNLYKYKTQIEECEESELNNQENILYVQNLHDKWHEKMVVLKSLVWHSGIKEIEIGLSRIESYVKEKEKTETLAELNALIDYIEHYSEDFNISIENIL